VGLELVIREPDRGVERQKGELEGRKSELEFKLMRANRYPFFRVPLEPVRFAILEGTMIRL